MRLNCKKLNFNEILQIKPGDYLLIIDKSNYVFYGKMYLVQIDCHLNFFDYNYNIVSVNSANIKFSTKGFRMLNTVGNAEYSNVMNLTFRKTSFLNYQTYKITNDIRNMRKFFDYSSIKVNKINFSMIEDIMEITQ